MVLPVRGVFPGESFAREDAVYAYADQKETGILGIFPKNLLKKAYLRFSYGQQAEKRICFFVWEWLFDVFFGEKEVFYKN